MEDSRRPFTPLIPNETPTPEDRSLSPVGGGARSASKGGKGASAFAADSSTNSPNRRSNQQGKDASGSRKEGGGGGGKSQSSKKGSTAATAAGANPAASTSAAAATRKSKENKSAAAAASTAASLDREALDDTLTKQSLIFDASSSAKMFSDAQQQELAIAARPDSQAQMRAESALSLHAPSTIAETGYVPFSVEPAFGRCEPGKTVVCKVINPYFVIHLFPM